MSNELLTDDIIVKDALRLLINNLVATPLVYRNYEQNFVKKVGESIRLELPYRTRTAEGSSLVVQPMVDLNTDLTINRRQHFALNYTDTDRTLSIQNFRERYLKSGVAQLANVVDRSVLATLKSIFHSGGVPGTTPGNYLAFSSAAAFQTDYAVPDDGMRRAVVNPTTCSVLSNEVKGLFNEAMVKGAYMKGYKGDIAGYTMHETQNLPSHTVGALGGTPLINGANQTGTELATDGWTPNTQVLNMGDVFTIDGVYGVNPQSYETTNRLHQFVAMEDVISDGSGEATITVSPALNDGTLVTNNSSGQLVSLKAYQNVTNAPADNAAISVFGAAGQTYRQDYLFHKECIALAMVDLVKPSTAVVAERARDEQTGLSMLLTGGYNINDASETHRIDVLWGTKAIYPELGYRLWGAGAQ